MKSNTALSGSFFLALVYRSAFILSIALTGCQAQNGFTSQQLNEDLLYYRQNLERLHPAVYKFTTKKKLDSIFKAVLGRPGETYTLDEVFIRTSRIMAAIKDGHSDIYPPSRVDEERKRNPFSFPLGIRKQDNKIFITKNFGAQEMDSLLGYELIDINGHNALTLVEDMMKLLPADGDIQSGKLRAIEKPVVFSRNLWALIGPASRYDLRLMKKNSEGLIRLHVDGITHDKLQQNIQSRYQSKPGLTLELKREESIAVMTIRSFSLTPTNDLDSFIPQAFKEIAEAKIEFLILDIRDNGGGNDHCGRDVFAHLYNNQPYMYYTSIDAIRNDFGNLEGVPALAADYFTKDNNGFYSVSGNHHPNLGPQHLQQPVFAGKVFLLINGNSFSTTSEVAAMLHYYQRATVIGEETGGRYTGNTAGYFPVITLPNSKIRTEIPVLEYKLAIVTDKPHRGVIPDHEVIPSPDEIIRGVDVEMQYTLNLIREIKEKNSQADFR